MKSISLIAMVAVGGVLGIGCSRAAPTAAEDAWAFVEDGRAVCSVVATGHARVDADLAFFTNAVACATGAALPVVSARGDAGAALAFAVHPAAITTEDDWSIDFPDARTMRISGSETSCRWALNRLLEERLGVVFCFPGPHGTHYPRRSSFTLPRTPARGTASFRMLRNLWREDPEWERCLGGKREPVDFFNHALCRIFPKEKYGQDPWREKIMPEHDGRRISPKENIGWQPCFASAACAEEAIGNVCAELDRHPEIRACSLSVNDNQGFCQCAACKALDGGKIRKSTFLPVYDNHSESYYRWVDKVARGVAARHPRVVLGLLAYMDTIDPPSFRLPDNVYVMLCCDLHQQQDATVFARREKLFAAWNAKARWLGTWGYDYGAISYVIPRLYRDARLSFFAWRKQFPAMNGYFGEGSNFVGEGPKRYLFYRRMFDAAGDDAADLARWLDAVCGPAAAPHLRAYYDALDRFWKSDALKANSWWGSRFYGYMNMHNQRYAFALTRAEIDRLDADMARAYAAAQAAGDAEQRARAEQMRDYHRYWTARAISYGAGRSAEMKKAAAASELHAALPEISRATERSAQYGARVLAAKAYEKGRADYAAAGSMKEHFAKRANEVLNPGYMLLMNRFVDWCDHPSVTGALARAAVDARILPAFRAKLAGLAALAAQPELLPPGAVKFTTSRANASVDGLKQGRTYFCSMTLRNASARRLKTWAYFASWNEHLNLLREYYDRDVWIEPGEEKTIRFLCKLAPETHEGRFSVDFCGTGLKNTDEVKLGAFSLKEIAE